MTTVYPPGVLFKCSASGAEVHVNDLDLTEGMPVMSKVERERATQRANQTLARGVPHHADEKSERVTHDLGENPSAKARRSPGGNRASQQQQDQTSDNPQ